MTISSPYHSAQAIPVLPKLVHTLSPVQYPVCHGVLLPLAIGIPALCLQHRDHMAAGHVHAQPLVRLVRAHWLQWTPGTTIVIIVKSEI